MARWAEAQQLLVSATTSHVYSVSTRLDQHYKVKLQNIQSLANVFIHQQTYW